MSVTSKCTPNVSQNEHENKCTQMYKNVFRCRLHLHTFADRVLFLNVFFSINVFFSNVLKCTPNVLPNVHFVFPDFPRIVEIQMYPNVHLCTSQMYSKCTLKCTPDVHFVFPSFPRIVEIQMYLNVHVHTFRFTAS